MNTSITESPIFKHPKPWWIPFLSLFITLYGILVLDWDLQPIIFLFWWELILMVGAAIVRMVFALDGQPVQNLLFQKIGLLIGSSIMGGVMIMLAVAFSFKAFEGEGSDTGLASIPNQVNAMCVAYLIGLGLHFFANGRYKKANPGMEIMKTFVHLLILLAFIMAITMHFLPAHPAWNQAKWVAFSVVFIKFLVDYLFSKAVKDTIFKT